MKGRKQKTLPDTCLSESRAVLEGMTEGQTFLWMNETAFTDNSQVKFGMLEMILSPSNLNAAYKQVTRNKGAGGVDKMQVKDLLSYFRREKSSIINSLLMGTYRPNPARRVEIPKPDGSKRPLGIPTVVDRLIQQAISQILIPVYEQQFSSNSFGFRPRRSAHHALRQVQSYANSGYRYAVDMDLEKFFDTVSHSKLIEVLSRTIKDGRVVSLIHKYLKSGVMISHKYEPTLLGVPQGSPLSPLLGNIMLNELDKELECRGHKFVRYADDMMILCKSKRSAERTLSNIIPYIEKKLFLRVNRKKTEVSYISKLKFLGYSFYIKDGKCRLRVHPKSQNRLKDKIRELTSRSNGKGNEWRKLSTRLLIQGWINYFKLADMQSWLVKLDEWYRRRLRMCIWKQWKLIKTRMHNLIKLGIPKCKAWEYANTRKGYWHTSNSPILSRSITNERLQRAGYLSFSDYYEKVRIVN